MDRRQFLKKAAGSSAIVGAALVSGVVPTGRIAGAQNPYEQFRVATAALNGRSGPGLAHGVVTVFAAGDRIEVSREAIEHADGYTWRLVNLKPGPVWVAEEFLEPADDGDPVPERLRVADGPLNMRSEPGLASTVTGVLEIGTIIALEPDASPVHVDGYEWVAGTVNDTGKVSGWFAMAFCEAI